MLTNPLGALAPQTIPGTDVAAARKRILVAGSANLDFVVRTARFPAPGETVLGHDFATFAGGKGANQALACARAGAAPTRMLLGLGNDAFAQPIEASLQQSGVELLIRRFDRHATGTAFITVADGGENAITVAPGANAALRSEDLPPLHDVALLLLQLETPIEVVTAWARSAHAAGVTVMLNAAPAPAGELGAELLAAVDVLVVNEGELAAMAGPGALKATARSSDRHGPGDHNDPDGLDARLARLDVPHVVVTLGARGCLVRSAAGRFEQAAFAVEVVDTTAAGDTFCGALAAALARQADWPQALREASAAAALACARAGAQASIPARAEVLALLAAQGRA